VLAILTGTLSASGELVDTALSRLFDVAESSDGRISDEIRIHAMNTLKTLFLDAKLAEAIAGGIERGFATAIRNFWSEKCVDLPHALCFCNNLLKLLSTSWAVRNVSMLLYSALVQRTFGHRQSSLKHDPASFSKRQTTTDFFSRFPSLHHLLVKELEISVRRSLDKQPVGVIILERRGGVRFF
jgi:hypothetical protein